VLLGDENIYKLEALVGEKLALEEGTVKRVNIIRVSPAMGLYPGIYTSLIYVSVYGKEKLLICGRGLEIPYKEVASSF